MNEVEADIAPTDSRLRPDQRYLEDGQYDKADRTKVDLEVKQRRSRAEREKAASTLGRGEIQCSLSWPRLRHVFVCLFIDYYQFGLCSL